MYSMLIFFDLYFFFFTLLTCTNKCDLPLSVLCFVFLLIPLASASVPWTSELAVSYDKGKLHFNRKNVSGQSWNVVLFFFKPTNGISKWRINVQGYPDAGLYFFFFSHRLYHMHLTLLCNGFFLFLIELDILLSTEPIDLQKRLLCLCSLWWSVGLLQMVCLLSLG